jgi:hypothetical protein
VGLYVPLLEFNHGGGVHGKLRARQHRGDLPSVSECDLERGGQLEAGRGAEGFPFFDLSFETRGRDLGEEVISSFHFWGKLQRGIKGLKV